MKQLLQTALLKIGSKFLLKFPGFIENLERIIANENSMYSARPGLQDK